MANFRISRLVLLLVGLALVAAAITAGIVFQRYQDFLDSPVSLPEEGTIFTVASGSSLRKIARQLQEAGIVSSPKFLIYAARENGLEQKIRSGEFSLKSGLKPVDLLNVLATGATVQYSLTLLEGWTFRQFLQAIHSHPQLVHTLADIDDGEIMNRIGHPGEYPEGRFLPETYHFPRGETDVNFLRRSYDAMERVLENEWKNRDPDSPLDSPYEALILASIVERETGVDSERAQVAGVFVRRLRKGMLLQTDPTVIYGMGDAFDGNIRRADLRRDTPYNTYTRKGLPPTPIAMPGAASIHAALHPAPGRALYFVARGDGTHQFSDTLIQHNAAVSEFQLKRRKR